MMMQLAFACFINIEYSDVNTQKGRSNIVRKLQRNNIVKYSVQTSVNPNTEKAKCKDKKHNGRLFNVDLCKVDQLQMQYVL